MSKIICPKCDHAIDFDASSYKMGQSLVFECEKCRKSFTIRIGETADDIQTEDFGYVVVIENTFCLSMSTCCNNILSNCLKQQLDISVVIG